MLRTSEARSWLVGVIFVVIYLALLGYGVISTGFISFTNFMLALLMVVGVIAGTLLVIWFIEIGE